MREAAQGRPQGSEVGQKPGPEDGADRWAVGIGAEEGRRKCLNEVRRRQRLLWPDARAVSMRCEACQLP